GAGSVTAGTGSGGLEASRTRVAEEVVARKDVVDLEAVGAGVALADVTLEEGLVADDRPALPVPQERLRGGSAARLARGRKDVHRRLREKTKYNTLRRASPLHAAVARYNRL